MDDSTRSTDHMLGEEDVDFSLTGISLSSLGRHHKKGKEQLNERERSGNTTSSTSANKPPRSSFEHLIPKQHHDKMNRLHKQQNSSSNHNNPSPHDSYSTIDLSSTSSSSTTNNSPTGTVTDTTVGKLRYELWEGKNKFLCGGRIMMGVHSKHLILTTALLIGTNATFLFLLVPLLERPFLFYTGATLAILNLILLFLTAFTDPGIIPRRPPSKLLENMSADAREKVQYCHTCRIVRPPRAKHCRYCDNCVEVFDHHCPWTGTCIGVRNYRYFCGFVILTVVSTALCCATSIYLIVRWAEGRDKRHGTLMYVRDTVAPLLSTWSLMVFCLVGALLVFHLFLMSRSQTTNEFLRGVRPVNRSSSGCYNSVCGSIPPSKLLPMNERRTEHDDAHNGNAVAYAISSLRSAVEEHA